jgi:two-component system response regulator YesN
MNTLIISSYDDFEFARKSLQLRTSDYILKPIDNELVYQSIQNVKEAQRMNKDREAARILLTNLPHQRKLIEDWIETLNSTREERLPKLIKETLHVLQELAGENFYLLPQLAVSWVKAISEEIQVSESFILDEAESEVIHQPISLEEVKNIFFRNSEFILENGGNQLVKEVLKKKDNQETKVIENIREYVKDHLRKDIKLQELAEHVALNKTYMCTVFKQETNMTIWNYIVLERMNLAREKLLNSTDKIYEIANFVGYEDVNYFSTLFRKHFGLSPLDYRKRALR